MLTGRLWSTGKKVAPAEDAPPTEAPETKAKKAAGGRAGGEHLGRCMLRMVPDAVLRQELVQTDSRRWM